MLEIASHILPAISEFGTMLAAPILAAAFFVAVGGGALDDTIIGVEDSLIRWWRELFHRKHPLLITVDGDKSTRHMGIQPVTSAPVDIEAGTEQLELTSPKERRRSKAKEAVAALNTEPNATASRTGPPPTSPRVIGTRRRRSRGNSRAGLEMDPF
ncbi:hypothetical protein FRC07_001868 [Ceratobasidium sp. 392]|nr:hypothetical protein FRC07_001868 [Ceratobasidium sp. 392]